MKKIIFVCCVVSVASGFVSAAENDNKNKKTQIPYPQARNLQEAQRHAEHEQRKAELAKALDTAKKKLDEELNIGAAKAKKDGHSGDYND